MKTASLALAMALAGGALSAQTPAPSPAPPAEKKAATASAGADGFVIQSDGGDYRLQVRAYTHFDGRFYPGDDAAAAADQFLFRRLRPILTGAVAKNFEFTIMPDFGGGTTVLQDAYLDVRYTAKARLRVGKFKEPVGLERLQSATAIAFVERAFPTGIAPNRDLGAQLHGDLGGGVVSYAFGVFNGVVDGGSGDGDANDGKDVAARVFVSPFKRGTSWLKGLGFGVAGTVGEQSGALPSYRSNGQLTIASYVTGAVADGRRKRIVPQLSLYSGPLGLAAEYAQSDAFVRRAANGPRSEVRARAWQATASWVLTGEAASYAGVRPKSPFDPARGQWGALEVAARVSGFELDDAAFANGLFDATRSVRDAFAWAVGLNWHLNRHVKQALDYERTTFTGGAAAGGDRANENALFFRTQLSF